MRKAIVLLLVFLGLLIAPTVLRYVQYYELGGTDREAPPTYDPAQIAVVPTPVSYAFVDEPTQHDGLVLLDMAHNNQFSLADISSLDGRLAARGFELLQFTQGDLARQLRPVNAFITITPLDEFSSEEIQAITGFVARGGRMLMVGDPTRYQVVFDENDPFAFEYELQTNQIPLNSLANEFGLIYNGDYLYNTVENEGNFRNIILKPTGFAEDALVDGLAELAVYSTHSIQVGPEAKAIITADDNTWSSATDRPGDLVVAATGGNGRVLALGDVHFLTNPYSTVYDNNHFIANIADFLTQTDERALTLVDFPYFYQQPVNLIYTDAPDLGAGSFTDIIGLQTAFQKANIQLSLASEPKAAHDTLYLGLYNQSDEVADILASVGISLTIEPAILAEDMVADEETAVSSRTPSNSEIDEEATEPTPEIRLIHSELGNIEMSGTALIVLDESNGRRQVVVLAASREGLENTVSRLLDLIPLDADTALGNCLVQDPIALCPTLVTDEPVEAELITSGSTAKPATNDDEPEADDTVEPGSKLDATAMGSISLGETVSDIELAEAESQLWTFNEGPVFLDIVLEPNDEMDVILEVYDGDNLLIASSASGLTGEPETLAGVDISDDGDYSIVVYDYYGTSGTYTLSVAEGEAVDEGQTAVFQSIFLFIDDDGEPIGDGTTSADALLALLEPDYDVTTWTTSSDGPLDLDILAAYGLIIWDSGDYVNPEGFLDYDTGVIFSYLEDGGNLLIIGSSPSVFGELPLSELTDVSVTGDDPILLDGLTPGDVVELEQVVETAVSDSYIDTLDPAITTFLLRGPESEDEGNIAAFAVNDEALNQKSIFLMFPFSTLPTDIQATLLENIFTWFTDSANK